MILYKCWVLILNMEIIINIIDAISAHSCTPMFFTPIEEREVVWKTWEIGRLLYTYSKMENKEKNGFYIFTEYEKYLISRYVRKVRRFSILKKKKFNK